MPSSTEKNEKDPPHDFNEKSDFSKESGMSFENANQISEEFNVTRVNFETESQTFEYSENNGIHPIKLYNMEFITKWSRANIDCIYVYNHHPNLMESVAIARDKNSGETFKNFAEIEDPGSEIYDASSDFYLVNLDEIVIWKNKNGDYLLTKVNSIEYKGRNSEFDRVNFTCQIRQQFE